MHAHGRVNDQAGIDELGRVERLGDDAAVLFGKDAVSAVFAAAHDEVCDNGICVVGGEAQNDATARIGILLEQRL